MLGTVLGTGDTIINQKQHGHYPHEACSLLKLLGINLKIALINLKTVVMVSVRKVILMQ